MTIWTESARHIWTHTEPAYVSGELVSHMTIDLRDSIYFGTARRGRDSVTVSRNTFREVESALMEHVMPGGFLG